jgi:hypothetical protein
MSRKGKIGWRMDRLEILPLIKAFPMLLTHITYYKAIKVTELMSYCNEQVV